MKKKSKVRFPALGALLTHLGGVAVLVAADPALLATAAGKLGVSAVTLGGFINIVIKPLLRQEHER